LLLAAVAVALLLLLLAGLVVLLLVAVLEDFATRLSNSLRVHHSRSLLVPVGMVRQLGLAVVPEQTMLVLVGPQLLSVPVSA